MHSILDDLKPMLGLGVGHTFSDLGTMLVVVNTPLKVGSCKLAHLRASITRGCWLVMPMTTLCVSYFC